MSLLPLDIHVSFATNSAARKRKPRVSDFGGPILAVLLALTLAAFL